MIQPKPPWADRSYVRNLHSLPIKSMIRICQSTPDFVVYRDCRDLYDPYFMAVMQEGEHVVYLERSDGICTTERICLNDPADLFANFNVWNYRYGELASGENILAVVAKFPHDEMEFQEVLPPEMRGIYFLGMRHPVKYMRERMVKQYNQLRQQYQSGQR